MRKKLIFFNTGWMDFYRGLKGDTITGGGKHVINEGWGGEMFNFQSVNGKVYGYVQPKIDRKNNNPSSVKIEKIGAEISDDKISGVTVVWTATDPVNGGTYIVGWYLNATVFRYSQQLPKTAQRNHKRIYLDYYASCKIKDATLLVSDKRVARVRRQEKNWMGQSNVWYAENNATFKKVVKDYIFNGSLPVSSKLKRGLQRQSDPLKRLEVEKRAINVVTKHYRKLGYKVESFEKDNVGWDLTATNLRTKLKLEVKGLSGTYTLAELTPNEFLNLEADKDFYRLCIVTGALTKPNLRVFAYSSNNGQWTSEDGATLQFERIISARVSLLHIN